MAEGDTRIESLEDELKVLKGEVRRTLVDLRALLMREDSPLSENAIARRMALAPREGGGDTQPVAQPAAVEITKQETPQPVAAPPSPAPTPPPPVNPPPPVAPSPDPANAERERAMADQQRRLDEQERRMAEQELRLADAGREAREGGVRAEADQQRRLDEQERRIAEQERRFADSGEEAREGGVRAEADQQRKLDEQESRMAEQERRLADAGEEAQKQERRLADAAREAQEREERMQMTQKQDHKLADAAREAQEREERAETARNQEPPVPLMEREERDEPPKKQDRPTVRRAELEPVEEDQDLESEESFADESNDDFHRYQPPGEDEEERTMIAVPKSSRKKPSSARDPDDDPDLDNGEELQSQIYEDEDPAARDDELPRKRPTGAKPGKRARGEEIFFEEDEEEQKPAISHRRRNSNSQGSNGHGNGNGQGSRVYQEYMELLGETEELGSENDSSTGSPALDVNLIANLTRWAVIAKQRVDGQRLNKILDLYAQLGHLTPDLRGLLAQIIDLVDENPLDPVPVPTVPKVEALTDVADSKVNADAQSCIDLIFQLHGILAGSPATRPVTAPKVANPIA